MIAVYAIGQVTGEPTLIQNVDTRGMRPRTFALDPAGRALVAAKPGALSRARRGAREDRPRQPGGFFVGADGKLDFVRKYDVAISKHRNMLWMGIVPVR